MCDPVESNEFREDWMFCKLPEEMAVPLLSEIGSDQIPDFPECWNRNENFLNLSSIPSAHKGTPENNDNTSKPSEACTDYQETEVGGGAGGNIASAELSPLIFFPEQNTFRMVIPQGPTSQLAKSVPGNDIQSQRLSAMCFLDVSSSLKTGAPEENLFGDEQRLDLIVDDVEDKGCFTLVSANSTVTSENLISQINPLEDVNDSTVSAKSGSQICTSRKTRAQRKSVPSDKKDAAYWEKRSKNNESARRSRQAAKAKHKENLENVIKTALRMNDELLHKMVSFQVVMDNLKDNAEQHGLDLSSPLSEPSPKP